MKIHAGRTADYQTALCGAKTNVSLKWGWFTTRKRYDYSYKPRRKHLCEKCISAIRKPKRTRTKEEGR